MVVNGLEANPVIVAQHGERDRCGEGETLWENIQEAHNHRLPHHPHAGVEVGNFGGSEVIGELRQRPFGGSPQEGHGHAVAGSGSDHHSG